MLSLELEMQVQQLQANIKRVADSGGRDTGIDSERREAAAISVISAEASPLP